MKPGARYGCEFSDHHKLKRDKVHGNDNSKRGDKRVAQ